ncbi:MAG: hypothetical protein FMNOHCHN_01672 [Ignavibacteriaceae bacterium]|nr:hypothetical protein [Ignavibacteriaceae bacterium]
MIHIRHKHFQSSLVLIEMSFFDTELKISFYNGPPNDENRRN